MGLKNFRCFQNVEPVDIRPLTLLVGENSTGKTSFLAALRFATELFQRGTQASFNKDPYSLGSFKEIAHYRGGRAGRADDFSFYLSIPVRVRRLRMGNGPDMIDRDAVVCTVFHEVDSQPSVSSLEFTHGEYQMHLGLGAKAEFSYKTPSMTVPQVASEQLRLPLGYDAPDFNAVSFLLRDAIYIFSSRVRRGQDREGANLPSEQDINAFEQIMRATEQSLPQAIFAGAPVRTKPARTYDNIEATPAPEGSHIPYLLARMKAYRPEDWEKLREGLIEFGVASGLFKDIDVKKFGSSPSSPFQLAVDIAGPPSNLMDVGYGVSQALPVIAETLQARRGSLFLLQQPEVHLHPRAQAALGTYLGMIARQRRLTIVAETHSDYLIDRIRMDVRDKKGVEPKDVSILFFERDGLDVTVRQLEIDERGNIIGAPPGYRRFFLEEQLRSIE